jgi:hypothetical protein
MHSGKKAGELFQTRKSSLRVGACSGGCADFARFPGERFGEARQGFARTRYGHREERAWRVANLLAFRG